MQIIDCVFNKQISLKPKKGISKNFNTSFDSLNLLITLI